MACIPEHYAKMPPQIITQRKKYSPVRLYKVFDITVQSCNYFIPNTTWLGKKHYPEMTFSMSALGAKKGHLLEYRFKMKSKENEKFYVGR